MKRFVKYRNTFDNSNSEMMKLTIEVVFEREEVAASTILDINDSRYFDFEHAILMACELRDFELIESYRSDSENSVSQYYIYTKTDPNGVKLKLLVEIRISDHTAPGRRIRGKNVSQEKLRNEFLKGKAKEIAQDKFNQTRGFRWRPIDIVFDDDHFTSYEQALREIEDRLDEFDPPDKYQ